jgi:hypothetical protein
MLLLSLVGEQPTPNLIPLWQYRKFNATQFAATDKTWTVAEQLAAAMRSDPLLKAVEVLPTLKLEAYDIRQARQALSAALNQQLKDGREVVLNLTAGTKLMSLASMQAAFGTGVRLLYVSSEIGQHIWMASDGTEQERQPIEVHISAAQYLRPHGLEVAQPPHDPSKVGSPLEEQVYRKAVTSRLFDDVQRNVKITRLTGGERVENELDVVVTRNGRLAVVSCKTGSQVEKTQNLNKALYELSALSRREKAGIYCVKVLVLEQANPKKAVIERAREMGIHLVFGNELSNIAEHLRTATEK